MTINNLKIKTLVMGKQIDRSMFAGIVATAVMTGVMFMAPMMGFH